jgi:stage II sporulation protein D
MRTPSWTAAILAIAASACAPRFRPTDLPAAPLRAPATIRVQVVEAGKPAVRPVALEEYVQATIISEFAPASGKAAVVERMLEVQAVISRTYAVAHMGRHRAQGFDLCATTHCQLFQPSRLKTSRWASAAHAATLATSGAILWYGNRPASALFHADCGGRTSSAFDVWGGRPEPYLTGIKDDGPAKDAHATWTYEATNAAVLAALNADARTRIGSRLDRVEVSRRDDAGRVVSVTLKGAQQRTVRGEDFRETLSRAFGARTIRSTSFEIARDGERFIFEGRGFGHGVGLCQAGALARLRAGKTPLSVLQRYYSGARLVKMAG